MTHRTILHLDMDAFFAAVELLDSPALKGVPVVVGSPPDQRGVVSTCSYEARKFGVHSAMPSRTAYRLCPQAVFILPRMERYAEVSRQVMAILESVTPEIEQVSVDEAFLDVTGVLKRWPSAEAIARYLKQRIYDEILPAGTAPGRLKVGEAGGAVTTNHISTGASPVASGANPAPNALEILSRVGRPQVSREGQVMLSGQAVTGVTASVGIAPNKFLAKLASDLHKPDGLTLAPFEPVAIRDFLKPLPVERIWGVGKVTAAELQKVGIRTIGDVQARSAADLARLLGSAATGAHLRHMAFGEDDRPVESGEVAEKSISNETTFGEDCADSAIQRQTLLELAEQVGRRLRAAGKVAGTVQIKVRFADFRTITRQCPLRPPGNGDAELIRLALELFNRERVTTSVRLLGFGTGNLTEADTAAAAVPEPVQLSLFAEEEDGGTGQRAVSAPGGEARIRLDRTVDELRQKFGTDILKRGRWKAVADEKGR